jgi:hypothetical protein
MRKVESGERYGRQEICVCFACALYSSDRMLNRLGSVNAMKCPIGARFGRDRQYLGMR